MKSEKLNEVRELIRMYLENISEDIDRTREGIARLEGKLTALNIERSRLESIQKRLMEESGAKKDGGEDE